MADLSLFLLIDIDNTLYEYSTTGFDVEMHDRIFQFAKERVGITHEEAQALSLRYYLNYGLSLHGYVKHYNVDPEEYSKFVHQCSYRKLSLNQPLVDMLQSMKYNAAASTNGGDEEAQGEVETKEKKKGGMDHLYYFTNANRDHARHVLQPLGLKPVFTRPRPASSPINPHHRASDAEEFEAAVEWIGFSYEDQWRLSGVAQANKPMQAAYEAIYEAIDRHVAADEAATSKPIDEGLNAPPQAEVASKRRHFAPANVVMVDDSLMNLDAPLRLGWSAVWYAHGDQQLPDRSADGTAEGFYQSAEASGRLCVIRDILKLKEAVETIRDHRAAAIAQGKGDEARLSSQQ